MKEIPLTQEEIAIVDDNDFEKLNKFKWCTAKHKIKNHLYTYYAVRRIKKGKNVPMHREILELQRGDKIIVDHKDGNGLNNCRSNLRICTHSDNMRNQKIRLNGCSKYKGVVWSKWAKQWQSQVGFNKEVYFLGRFDSEIEAAKAYDRHAMWLFGEFANLNFPLIERIA